MIQICYEIWNLFWASFIKIFTLLLIAGLSLTVYNMYVGDQMCDQTQSWGSGVSILSASRYASEEVPFSAQVKSKRHKLWPSVNK